MACVRAVVVVVVLLAATPAWSARTHEARGASTKAAACHMALDRGVLPVWARDGFSSPRPRMPHVLGRSGRIVAILFGYPLRSPPAKGRTNKILWAPHTWGSGPAALWIRAQRMDGVTPVGAPVRRIVPGGPGPSIIDLPDAGCWRLTLAWSARRDTLDLAYGSDS